MSAELRLHVTDRNVRAALTDGTARQLHTEPRPASTTAWTPAELAAAAHVAVTSLRAAGQPATLLLPAAWCYVQPFTIPQRRPTRAMLTYALEEYLPVEVEQLTCDFLRTGADTYLGVAVETARLRATLAALAARGLLVERITLEVFAAADRHTWDGALLWCDAEHVALLGLDSGRSVVLRVIRLAAGLADDAWQESVLAHLHERPTGKLAVAGPLEPGRLAALAAALGATVADESPSPQAGSRVWQEFDLARGALAPAASGERRARVGRHTAAMALLALLVLTGGLAWHRARLKEQVDTIAQWEHSVYTELFPGRPVPTSAALRLASERRRLEGLTLTQAPDAAQRVDALAALRTLVAAVPPDLRIDLEELRLESTDVMLRGRLRDHAQAEEVAAALDGVAGLRCAAPRTQRSGSGVQFFLHAQQETEEHHERR